MAVILALVAGLSGQHLSVAAASTDGLHVAGNRLIDDHGVPVRLLGVNRSGTEYACIRGWGIFEGPADSASVTAMRAWYVNAVRIGLNEDCWLGINGVPEQFAGAAYQHAIGDYVDAVTRAGMYAIVDLHWSAPGQAGATSLRPMADLDHSVDFWRSVANTFADNPNVLFDAFNEPFDVGWDCWRDGCVYPGGPDTGPWHTVGMQTLVDTIRATGATQPILLGGLHFSNDVTGWADHVPDDPRHQLVASVHVYPFNPCAAPDCWQDDIAPLAASVPVVVGEVGPDWAPPYSDAMANDLMRWADHQDLGYLAWTWNTWGGGDALLTNHTGQTTTWGSDVRRHLTHLAVPRLDVVEQANAAYAAGDIRRAGELYDQAAESSSDTESQVDAATITGLARFRAVLAWTLIGDEDRALQELRSIAARDPGAALTRLAAQFWDGYGMTGSVASACAQLAPDVDSQAGEVLTRLRSLGMELQHDQLCVLPSAER